ncbi:helix-turn-helix domain-containing protein [Streptomyces sp. NPDC021020]|uniref:helix-turn-helix domain-containing protein n=1 Tax=Streptomyces sp. NPDC021020 TaxID=3365109 RepID=UPI0037A019B4
MAESRPTVRRRRLATVLLRLREEAGKTPEEAADRIGCHRSKISRIENAHLGVSLGELRDLLTFYGVDDPEYVEGLVDIARRSRERGWVQQVWDELPSYADHIDYEQTSNYIRSFQPLLISGLFQTADYARALYRANPAMLSDERIEQLVAIRMQRQEMLDSEAAPRICLIEGEAALRGNVGAGKTMAGQLDQLLALAERPNITLQMLPFSAGAHAGLTGGFVLFSFPNPAFSEVVTVEHRTGTVYLETPEETDTYNLTFDSLRSAALSPTDSRALILRVKEEL